MTHVPVDIDTLNSLAVDDDTVIKLMQYDGLSKFNADQIRAAVKQYILGDFYYDYEHKVLVAGLDLREAIKKSSLSIEGLFDTYVREKLYGILNK